MVKSVGLFALAACASAILVGCENKAPDTGNSVSTQPSTTTAAGTPALKLTEPPEPKDAVPSAPPKQKYSIGVSLLTQDDEFYKALKQGLEDEAAKQNVTVDIVSADKDLGKQTNQVQDFISKKENAIVVCPVDSKAIGGAISQANTANIPVFTADITSESGNIVSYIASDNVQGGSLDGDFVAKLLNGKGKVGILDLTTVTSVQDRVKGFKDAIAKFPGIQIVADDNVPDAKRENALPKAQDMLTTHPDINVIFAINDPVALGALAAVQQMKKDNVVIVGYDAVPEAQTDISSGTSPLKADAIQYPHLIGATTIDAVIKSLNGEQVPKKIAVPTGLVTKDSFSK